MPLTAESPAFLHVLQNISLIVLSLLFAPLLTLIVLAGSIISPYLRITDDIKHTRQWRQTNPSPEFKPRTVLVTGVGMSKGLIIARSFYRAGHNVIGADFVPHGIPVCGSFSSAISKFYSVRKPAQSKGTDEYISDLFKIVRKEHVDLWVSCSGVASAVEDGLAKEALEKIGVPAVQFGVKVTSLLHEKDSFIENTKRIGLNVPETHLIHSTADALSILYPSDSLRRIASSTDLRQLPNRKKTYILKSVGLDDSIRADMTRLPLNRHSSTSKFISKLRPSPDRPFVLQEFVQGPEYCTHSIVIRGEIKAFAACKSSELLMHYSALPSNSSLFKAMLRYTEVYAARMDAEFTGHFSLDFLVQGEFPSVSDGNGIASVESLSQTPRPNATTKNLLGIDGELQKDDFTGHFSRDVLAQDELGSGNDPNTENQEIENLMERLFPIECNPRAHTAAVLFSNQPHYLSNIYLSLLHSFTPSNPSHHILTPTPFIPSYYWIGHDLVTKAILPIFQLLALKIGILEFLWEWVEFIWHMVSWKDGTWEVWDPWPIWWLYVIYWPGMWGVSLWERRWWSRCNVSTTKMFRC